MKKAQTYFTNIWKTLAIALLGLSFLFVSTNFANANAGINRVINFQGKVVNKTAGTNVANTNYDFTFKIYAAASGGSPIWTENFNTTNGNQLTVTDGIFRAALGSVCTFSGSSCQGNTNSAVDFNSDSLFLDITFNGETMGSRIQLTAVPYAFNAEKVSGLTVTNNGGNTLNIAASKTVTFADTFSTVNSGSDTLTNNTTGFALAGGTTTPKTLTISDSTTLNTNSIALAGETLTLISGHSFTLDATNGNTYTFPSVTAGTVVTTNQTSQVINSGQTSGTILAINAGTPALASALTGQTITLNGTNAQAQTGLQFSVSGTGTLKDIVGTGSTWSITSGGALTVASCSGCGGGGATLQSAYGAGATITTTTGSDIAFVLPAGLGTRTKFSLTNSDTTAGSDFYLNNANASATTTNGMFIEQTGAGTLTNGIQIKTTSGSIGTGLTLAGTFTTLIGAPNFSISNAGAVSVGPNTAINPNASGTIALGTANTTGVTIGNNSGTTSLSFTSGTGAQTFTSSVVSGTGANSAFVLADSALAGGTGLQITPPDPKIDNNSGVLTSGKLINVSSTDHSYMNLDNRDLTVGGHKNQVSISNVQSVYVYNTSNDSDGGRWTSDDRSTVSSWYSETGSAASASPVTGAACQIGTNFRCGQAAFPDKAIIVVAGAAGSNTLYVFDAKDNSLWMAFNQNAGANAALGINANNTISSVYALNGNIYVGTNGSAATGAYEINFKTDKITRYNNTDTEDFALGPISQRNASSGTAYISQGRTSLKLTSVTVQSVFAQVVYGKTFFLTGNGNATAANGGISLINETNQTVANLGVANDNIQSLFYTTDDKVYALSSTNSELDVWYNASTFAAGANNTAKSTFYSAATIPALWPTAPTVNTSAPEALSVTQGTSDADGKSNTIYAGFNQGMVGLEEKVGSETGGAVKYYTSNSISEEMFGDARTMLPMAGTGTVATGTTISGADADVSVKAAAFTTKGTNGVTHSSGIRGKAMTFDGTNYLCTGTTGTCANNTNVDVAQTNFSMSFWVKTASNTNVRLLVNKQATAGQVSAATAGYYVGINASHQLTSTVTDGTTYVTATSTRIVDDSIWHFISVTMNRPTTGAACSATNVCTLTQYIDGNADGITANAAMANAMTNATQLALMATSAGASVTTGSMDEFTFTAMTLSSSQVMFMNNIGSVALNNPNHSGATTIRNVSVAQDGANALQSSNVVKAISPYLDNGNIYIGGSGGVSVIGMYSDTVTDLYSASINTKDDINTNYDSTNGNAVNSISVVKGYGQGVVLGIGMNNSTAGGAWMESSDTFLKDFLSSSYNPFGQTLMQSVLDVDTTLRVTNQISTRLSNLAGNNSSQTGLVEFFRADNNGAAATAFKGIGVDLNLQSGTSGQIKFQDQNGITRGRLDTGSPYGTGADGAIAITTTKNLNTDIIASGRAYADGIAYRVITPVNASGAVSSFSRYSANDNLSNGIAAGDEIMIINIQGNVGDVADAGKYMFARVLSVTPSTITISGTNAGTTFGGTTATNQKLVIQRVPNYTSVTLTGGGILTASAYDGLTTTPTGTAGYLTGIVAFRANGTVSVATGTSINTTGKGYRGGAGGNSGITTGAISGETFDSLTLTSGSGVGAAGFGTTAPVAGFGGGSPGNNAVAAPGSGGSARGGGGGGGSSGNGASTAGGGGGAGGGYGTTGGGGGGSGSTASSAGGAAGASSGGGGGGTDTAGTGGAGGTNAAGATATGGTGLGVGGAIGSATNNGGGGGGALNAIGGGAGGGGGGGYGAAALTAGIYLGSGGGGGGGSTDTATAGGNGGAGGGIVYITADTIVVTSTGAINAQGVAGGAGTTNSGSGGSGSGGSIFLQGRSMTLGSSLVTAAAVAGTAKVGKGGGGGGGGVGRIATTNSTNGAAVSGTTTPAATANAAQSDYGALYVRATNTTAGDVAENYTTGDPTITKGDVVILSNITQTIDGNQVGQEGVLEKTNLQYDAQVVGVISSDPGLLLNNTDSSTDTGDQRAVALVGRVPIKVSTENGPILVGDYLTTSSVPGVAMKAIKAGPVIARALEEYSGDKDQVGLINGFVKASYFNGVSIQNYLSSLPSDNLSVPASQQLLNEFIALNSASQSADTNLSQILTDQVAAGLEVITPHVVTQTIDLETINISTSSGTLVLSKDGTLAIKDSTGIQAISFDSNGNATFTGTITADKIKANQIEGLEVITDKLSLLDSKIATIGATFTPQATSSANLDYQKFLDIQSQLAKINSASNAATLPQGVISLSSINVEGIATVSGDLRVKGNGLFEGVLTVLDTLTTNNFIVNGASTFFQDALFKAKVSFEGPVTFSSDAGGQAVVTKGTDRVTVSFDQEFEQNPIVNASVSFDEQKDSQGNVASTDQLEQEFFDQGYSYLIVNKSTKGFTIVLNKKAMDDVNFTWTALRVKDAKIYQSRLDTSTSQ